MNQLLEHIEKHPSETQRLLGLSYDQLIGLITHASSLYDRQQKAASSQKIRLIQSGGGRPPKLAIHFSANLLVLLRLARVILCAGAGSSTL